MYVLIGYLFVANNKYYALINELSHHDKNGRIVQNTITALLAKSADKSYLSF